MAVAVLFVFFSGCTCREESFCDINQQFVFLPVGSGIVGDWFLEGDPAKIYPKFQFNEEGHFIHQRFGCDRNLFPVTPGGMNATELELGYQCTTLSSHSIEPGRFRLEYKTNNNVEWVEGKLLPDGKLKLESNISDSLSGTFVKRPPSPKGEKFSVPGEQP